MNAKYKVIPTSQTGQSLLESVERRGASKIIAAVSVQLPTEVANEIANHVNNYRAMLECLEAVLADSQVSKLQSVNLIYCNEVATNARHI